MQDNVKHIPVAFSNTNLLKRLGSALEHNCATFYRRDLVWPQDAEYDSSNDTVIFEVHVDTTGQHSF